MFLPSPASTIRTFFFHLSLMSSEESAGLVALPQSDRKGEMTGTGLFVKVRWTISASFSEYRRTVRCGQCSWPAQSSPSRFMCWRKSTSVLNWTGIDCLSSLSHANSIPKEPDVQMHNHIALWLLFKVSPSGPIWLRTDQIFYYIGWQVVLFDEVNAFYVSHGEFQGGLVVRS